MRKFKFSEEKNDGALRALKSGNAKARFHPPRETGPRGRTEKKLQNLTNELYSEMEFKPVRNVDVKNGDPERPGIGDVWLDESGGDK